MNRTKPAPLSMKPLVSEFVLVGAVGKCRIRLRALPDTERFIETLADLVAYLREHPKVNGASVVNLAALGAALHCTQRHERGIFSALDEVATALLGFPAMPVIRRMEQCAERHAALLTPKEIAARLVLEAGRIVKENSGANRLKRTNPAS